MDLFAQIAANGIGGRDDLLYTPKPESFEEKICVLNKKQKATNITPKMATRDELYTALSALKAKYKPFLEDLAPKLDSLRRITEIKNFKLNGEEITIPHYQGPLGNQKQVYETVFNAEISVDKAAYLCFDGADYYAVVYVNGVCVGTHEGFFSPFEFEVTDVIKNGENELKIELYND